MRGQQNFRRGEQAQPLSRGHRRRGVGQRRACRHLHDGAESEPTHPPWRPDPPQDRPGNPMPEYVAVMLHAVSILLGYGRHLLDTVRQRATAPTFPAIAACFGTANLSTIRAHLNRGILRATALQRYLLARAAAGRDIDMVTRRTRTDETPPAPADPQSEQPTEPARSKAAPRL